MTTTRVQPLSTPSVLDAIDQRRSVRSYLPDPVEESTICRLLDAAVQAPTAMHGEPWSFVVVQDPAVLARISERAKTALLGLASVPHELARAPGGDGAIQKMLNDPDFNIFYDASTLIVVCVEPLNDFVVADAWLAAENLMLAAHALGLGSCCIGFALSALQLPDVKAELGIPANIDPIAAVIVGVPRSATPPVPRKAPHVLRWLRPAGSHRPHVTHPCIRDDLTGA